MSDTRSWPVGVAFVGLMLLFHQVLLDDAGSVSHNEGLLGAILLGLGAGFMVRL